MQHNGPLRSKDLIPQGLMVAATHTLSDKKSWLQEVTIHCQKSFGMVDKQCLQS